MSRRRIKPSATDRAALPSIVSDLPEQHKRDLLYQAMQAPGVVYSIFDADRYLLDCSASYMSLHQIVFEEGGAPLRYDDLMRSTIRRSMPGLTEPEIEAELMRRIHWHERPSTGEFDRLYPGDVWLRVSRMHLEGGQVVTVGLDITALKQHDLVIAERKGKLRGVLDQTPVGIWDLDESGRTLYGNERLSVLFGGRVPGTVEALIGTKPLDGKGPFGLTPGVEETFSLPGRAGLPAGLTLLVCASDWLQGEGEQRHAILSLLDVSPMQAMQDRADHLACHDPLTGLKNGAWLRGALSMLAESEEPGALILLELDGLTDASERFGQEEGDRLLVETVARLQAETTSDEAVCRLGKDEFAFLLRGSDVAARARCLAPRLIGRLTAPVTSREASFAFSARIGYATLPGDAATVEALQRAAALALNVARVGHAGCIVPFHTAMRDAADRRRLVRERLADDISGDRLRLAWQVQVTYPCGTLRGAEALVRWPNCTPDGLELSPGAFLAEAAQAGLMPALDAWVLDAALKQVRIWRDMPGAPEIVAINVAPATLLDEHFPNQVEAALLRHRVRAEALEIEIPEILATRDLDAVSPILERLSDMGVRLALDDFGGGMSSIAHLIRLPVQLVKLDRQIVSGLPGPRERAIVSSVMAVAGRLSITVLAEGVETKAQADLLRQEGCTLMQGYYFGRPI